MLDAHAGIGMALVLGFAILTVVGFLQWRGSGPFGWSRYISYAVSALLFLQFVIGFGLLADDYKIEATHYLLALAVVLPVGAVHMAESSRVDPQKGARNAFLANLAALVLVFIVYSIGESA